MSRKRGNVGKRGKENRIRKPVFLFATEGDNKTEELYLQHFSIRNVRTVSFAPGNETDPVSMMEHLKEDAVEKQLSVEYGDRAFCLIDADTAKHKQSQIYAARKQETELCKVIVSVPCFEVWFLCHFKNSSKVLTSGEAVRAMQKHVPHYNKNSDIYVILKGKTLDAVNNAQLLQQFHAKLGRKEGTVDANPSTEMYKVITALNLTGK